MKNYLDSLPRPFLVLAPMEDVTDTVFRRVIQDIAPFDLYFTEFANIDGLQSAGRSSTMKRLKFEASEQPLIAQIWGYDLKNFEKTAHELVEMGFMGIDINMGCPAKAVVKSGCGGGLIQNPDHAVEIIRTVKKAVAGRVPISVKTRIGFRQFEPEWLERILAEDINMLSVHLRTVREMSLVDAHWELMPQIKQLRDRISPRTALVGNGDVRNREHAMQLTNEYGINGAMIGRGVFHDPFAAMQKSPWQSKTKQQKIDLYRHHVELFRDTWDKGARPAVTLNKFCKIYVSGFDGAKEIRETLMQCQDTDELHRALRSVQSTAVS